MKLALALSLLLNPFRGASGQVGTFDPKWKVFNIYEGSCDIPVVEDYGEYLGGGFIDGDNLFVVAASENEYAQLVKIPLTRNATTGKIINLNFTEATTVLDVEYLDNGFQNDVSKGPGDQIFYSIVPEDEPPNPESYYPYEVHHGTFNSAAGTVTFAHNITYDTWAGLGIYDTYAEVNFTGLFGIGFSPNENNIDPGTNFGYMIGTAPYGFWQVGLTGTAAAYNPVAANTRLLCSLQNQYPGGMAFIPTGSLKDSVMLANYDDDSIEILELDYTTPDATTGTTGLCIDATTKLPTLGTNNASITTFASGVESAWGFFFDPQTNDFFSTSWGDGQIVHFEGFPPGVDVQVVINNIQTEIAILGDVILSASRRELRPDGVSGKRNGVRGSHPVEPEDKSKEEGRALSPDESDECGSDDNGSDESGSEESGSSDDVPTEAPGPVEVVIDPVQVEAEVETAIAELAAGTATVEEVADTVTAPLQTTFENPSFVDTVLSGGESQEFVSNIGAVETAVIAIVDTPEVTSLPPQDQVVVQEQVDKIQALLDILKSVQEG